MLNLIINNNLFNVKTIMTSNDITNGMMGKKFNKDFNGMLFLMDDNNHTFWMVGCIIPLDIIFIKNNKITKIHKNCKPCKDDTGKTCKRYRGEGDMVLEVMGGDCSKYNIEEGMDVKFKTGI